MADRIDFHAMNDHDLLVMSVMQSNEIARHMEKMNGTVKDHERRITIMETQIQKPVGLSKKQAAGLGSSIFVSGSLVVAIINAIGKVTGWW
jgi:hypothetical protein